MGKKLFWLLLNAICIVSVLAIPLSAAAPVEQVIRVGVFDYEAFYGTDAKGNPYGYGYDYLDELAKYGNFTYEYVYGS